MSIAGDKATMTTLLFAHSSSAEHETGFGHPERPERIHAVMGALDADEFSPLVRREAPRADPDDVARAHPGGYVERLRAAVPEEGVVRIDADTVMSPASGEAALRAAGALIAAVDAVLGGEAENAFCAVRPPGHHAEPGRGMGFCLFNNIAIAARYAQTPACSSPRPTNFRFIPAPARPTRPASAISSTCRSRPDRGPRNSAPEWKDGCCRACAPSDPT